MNSVILVNPSDIDLDRHGLIEAHAGTGKTWTIVQMVLRILERTAPDSRGRERRIHIREILLVTYTEKAAGELKRRIRAGIADRLAGLTEQDSVALKQHLEDCLNNLHEALIGTIHAICLRLLQTWPFETGVHFNTRIIDDAEGLESALRESMRTDWQTAETLIPWALEQLVAQNRSIEEKHFKLIRDTALQLLDAEHACLDRTIVGGRRLKDLRAEYERNDARGFRTAAANLTDHLEAFNPPLGFHDNAVQAIASIKQWARQVVANRISVDPEYAEKISKYKKPRKDGVPVSTNIVDANLKRTDAGKGLSEALDAVANHEYVAALRTSNEHLLLTLICDAAEILAAAWNRAKREKGFVSYEDMLRLMRRAVYGSPAFRAALAGRLQYGIIDEFQDTSILQWEVFQRIFLDPDQEDGPRIFIVGDPKQSIFSFQGADVRSYLRAREAIERKGGRVYSLEINYRSLAETIDGFNTILGRQDRAGERGEDWFRFEGDNAVCYPSPETGGGLARPPQRPAAAHRLQSAPVRVMALEGNASLRRRTMARWAAAAIKALRGTLISVPNGTGWKNVQLDYSDFAVIVEAHKLAKPFLDEFLRQGIPAVKYKMEGVFQSDMARDLHALLRAILLRESGPAPRLAALLTHFFNRHPACIDPEQDLEPCLNGPACGPDDLCMAHAMQEWSYLADTRQWSRLFESIAERTGIRPRLIRLCDGERHLADLGQVTDYCMERLYRDNLGLEQLVEHLGGLFKEEERAGQDRNLHVLATQKSSVRVLTMHAAKGLEFPVVFAATGGTKGPPKGPGTFAWITSENKKLVVPFINNSSADRPAGSALGHANDEIARQGIEERRRLLYVALTRAQALLFVPMHFEEMVRDGNGEILWQECRLPRNPDTDLTPRLASLFAQDGGASRLSLFDSGAKEWSPKDPALGNEAPGKKTPALDAIPDVRALDLPSRICLQTSYTQLSRRAAPDREVDRSDEEDPAEAAVRRPVLPGGKHTGDALHLVMEEILRTDDAGRTIGNDVLLTDLVRTCLRQNGVLNGIENDAGRAIAAAVTLVQGALRTPLALPGGGTITIGGLSRPDRIPEMEFMLGVSPHWVHGFMDLVFRVRSANGAQHPWRYFVLDWKSDQVENFGQEAIAACIVERHYELQAKIYCHALDTYLRGILGSGYDPERNLGGAVYVFLRSFGHSGIGPVENTWARKAQPTDDREFVKECLRRS